MSNIIDINQYKKQKNLKMLFIIILLGAMTGAVVWKFYVENVAKTDIEIPASKNITFNHENVRNLNTAEIAKDFEKFDNQVVLLYIYTTWCNICKRYLPQINEIAQEFQNTELKFYSLAIDRDLDDAALMAELNSHGNIYFQPQKLTFKDGFKEFLKQKSINYKGSIPYTILINKEGKIVTDYIGYKDKNYLRNKIIKELYGQ